MTSSLYTRRCRQLTHQKWAPPTSVPQHSEAHPDHAEGTTRSYGSVNQKGLYYTDTSPRLGNMINLTKYTNKNKELHKMRQHRNMFQMKEKDKISEEELSQVEISNLPDISSR